MKELLPAKDFLHNSSIRLMLKTGLYGVSHLCLACQEGLKWNLRLYLQSDTRRTLQGIVRKRSLVH